MQHYFIDKHHEEKDYFEFQDSVIGYDLCFRSCNSIFSKNKIDDGTRVLLKTIDKYCHLEGYGLDLGCGLGAIAISLIKRFKVHFDCVDVNNTAVELTKQNLIKNNVQHNATAFYSNGFENIDKIYDFIITNPPIKTGKTLLFSLISDSYNHIKQNGQIVLVIRKDHGMESLKNHMLSVFKNCEILQRDKGYYILKSVKSEE